MKITIDTKQDSREDIRKAIKILQLLVDQTDYATSDLPEGDNVFGSILDMPTETETESTKQKKEFSIRDLQTY